MARADSRNDVRRRIHVRIRARVRGTAEVPRLNVFRSLGNLYAQIVDDTRGHTLVAASTLDQELRKTLKTGGNAAASRVVGTVLGERAKAAGVTRVVFDRGGYLYHGRVKALAEAARAAGMKF